MATVESPQGQSSAASFDEEFRRFLSDMDAGIEAMVGRARDRHGLIREYADHRDRLEAAQAALRRPPSRSRPLRWLNAAGICAGHRGQPFRVAAALADDHRPVDGATLRALDNDARGYARAGRWMFVLSFVMGFAFAVASYVMTGQYVESLESAKHPDHVLILLLVRGGLFGGLTVGILYAAFTVANAAVDQATRFRKRAYSAHMLNYAFQTFEEQIKTEKVKLSHVVDLFSAWNENVDSAFSRVAFQKHGKDVVASSRFGRAGTSEPVEQVAVQPAVNVVPVVVPVSTSQPTS